MAASPDPKSHPGLVHELLALPSLDQREALLNATDQLNPAGIVRLLDLAAGLVGSDPGTAQRLASFCAEAAEDADAPAALPLAAYIRSETHFINGEFDAALLMARRAHDGYVALGEDLEALRTNVGRMAVLLELGSYQEALDTGQTVLDTLAGADAGADERGLAPTREEADLLVALVHQNRGGCYEYMGRYDDALDAYATAERLYRVLGKTGRLGEVLDNRGAILLHLGRGAEALAAHEAAAAIFEGAGLTLAYAKALGNIGEAHLRLANYARSLDALKRARRMLDPLDALPEECFLLRNMAGAYLALNMYPEALAAYREVDGLLSSAGLAHERAQALWGMGCARAARSELEEAELALAGAASLFEEAGNVPLLSGVMLEQASLSEASGDYEAALTTAQRALELVSASEWPVQLVYAYLRLADLLLPDAVAAEPHLVAAQQLAAPLALPHLRYRLNERLGRLRRLQGRDEEARELLEAAVDEIERLRGTVVQETMRASFLRDKTASFEDLLLLHLAREDDEGIQRAFAIAEKAKSRALLDLLVGIVEKGRKGVGDPDARRMLRDLQADLNVTYDRLLGGEEEPGAPAPDLRERAVELEGRISRLRLQAATPDPFATPASTGDVWENPSPDTTLLAYHIAGGEIIAFVEARGVTRVVRNLGSTATVQRLLQRLDAQWNRFRAGSEFAGRRMALLERSARQILGSLYAELVAPLEPLLDGAPEGLVVVPHGPLHQVPFHALFDGERYLLERFEISYAPSARVYSLCQGQAPREPEKALVFSVPELRIPAVAAEAGAVARHLRGAEVRSNGRATVATLRDEAPGCDVLHLACHGLFRSDNPMFSALKLHDGWLTAADALDLELPGALVTLSACESGRGGVVEGDEILGLARAFLGAGASTLVVSLWLVQDETTAELMGPWYGRMRDGEGRASALRAAQLELKERYPHPYYWAPFILIGGR